MARTAAPRTKEQLFAEQYDRLEQAIQKLDSARNAAQKALKTLKALEQANKVPAA